MVVDYEDAKYEYENEQFMKKMVNRKNRMNDLVKVDEDMDLVEALESRFSLHDSDEIYNLLSEFSEVDTDCGRITFKKWIRSKK